MTWTSPLGSLRLHAAPALVAAAQVAEGGRGALRPYIHVFLAYAVVWIMILLWVWWIARRLKNVDNERTKEARATESPDPLARKPAARPTDTGDDR